MANGVYLGSAIKTARNLEQQKQALLDLKQACNENIELYKEYHKLYILKQAIFYGSFIVIIGGMLLFMLLYPYKNAKGGIDFPVSLYMALTCVLGFFICAHISNSKKSFLSKWNHYFNWYINTKPSIIDIQKYLQE